ncbi:hypothetical protein [Cupriavidus taiwanensis]|uniref:hypothetical protein n=1 Tax=Cupriavidus taiwanensis TaxID=164546 RepID=UPI000E10E575|nr:hypothetical protein [Cupriavidus taiwanensis]SOY48535.1 hypothetical protein CBM2592_A190041 [Cupriavidus taiwanensis]SOY83065.1 hypothetical protein CBM2591_A230043 [Cupriavidus taiwanensis]SPA13866.1 hypothetical protein CBM2631_A210043 [Cupriavidus taiwanensis]SPD43948.1 protein of unknown function [Cupriavidus taiwanensis]
MLKRFWQRITRRQDPQDQQSAAIAQLVALHIMTNVEVLHFDVSKLAPASPLPLLGYIYGTCKGAAYAAEFKEPEVFFMAMILTLRDVFGRDAAELIAVVRESWDTMTEEPEFVAGYGPGIDVGVSLIVEQELKTKDISALLFKYYRHCIGNEDIVARMDEMYRTPQA